MRRRSRRLPIGLAVTSLLVAIALPTAGVAAGSQPRAKAAPTYSLVLGDDDTNQLLGSARTRQLLTNVHQLLSAGRVRAVVRLIPKPYRHSERSLLKHAKWRNRALLLLSTHLNADAPDVVYPGFVHRCASHSDYSGYDVRDLRTLGRTVDRAKPCRSVWHYHGPVLVVRYWTKPGPRHGRPYFRGLTFPNN